MAERKRKIAAQPGTMTAVLLMALAVGLMVLLGVGLLMSAMVVRGWAKAEVLDWTALAALFLASLVGGDFACRKLRTMPLIWGVSVGGALALVCLAAGTLSYETGDVRAMALRIVVPLLGGALAGVMHAVRRK